MTYKRKKLNLSVKHKFQMWLLIRIFGTVILSSIVAAVILYFYSRHEITANFYSAHIKLRRVSDLLLPVIVAGSFVSLGAGMILALFLPQKIAGPLYRIEKNLRQLGTGNLKVQVKLRHDDTLNEFVEIVNNSINDLHERMQAVKNAHEVLEKALADNQDPEVIKQLTQQKTALALFKI